jgi:hypothetical protein
MIKDVIIHYMGTIEKLTKERDEIIEKQKDLSKANDRIWKEVHIERSRTRNEGLTQLADNARVLVELAGREREIYFELLEELKKPACP